MTIQSKTVIVTRDGKCLLVIQSKRKTSKVKVTANIESLPNKTIELEIK